VSAVTPLAEWLGRLESIAPREIILGLDRVQAVLAELDTVRPRKVLHVAGTNGKGSCVAMLGALLRGSGHRTGTYTSPHLKRYNERIAIDGRPVDDEDIISAFERIEAARGDVPLTYFEYGTLAAMLVFDDYEVDVAVYEVGLGGRLDAVNAIDPDAALITSIALDHQEWLGETREDIAREKAGIMRPGRPVVYAERDRPHAIDACAEFTGATLLANGRDFRVERKGDTWAWHGVRHSLPDLVLPGLPGEFQLDNAGGVLTLLEAAGFTDILHAEFVSRELGSLRLAGRSQIVEDAQHWRFDVAHNPAAAQALASVLEREPGRRRIAIVGMLDDKDVEGVVTALAPAVDDWIAVTAEGPRAIGVAELARRIANALNRHCRIAESLDAAIAAARELAAADAEILVCGSFHVVGPVQRQLGL